MIYPSEVKKASAKNNPPKFLSRKGRLGLGESRGRLSGRVHRLTQQADARLVARGMPTQLHPCPECDGCGLHKARCRFYLSRAGIQAQTNPNPSFNGYIASLIKATGPLGALA